MIPKSRAKAVKTEIPFNEGEWVSGWYFRDEDFNPFIIHDTGTGRVTYTAVDPETVCLKVPFINIFTDDIVRAAGYGRGRVKFGAHHLGEAEGLEFNAYGFYVEFKNIDGTVTELAINEHEVKFEVMGNIYDNPKIKLIQTTEDDGGVSQ